MAMGNDQCKSGTKILLSFRPDSLGILVFLSLLIETGFLTHSILCPGSERVTATVGFSRFHGLGL